VSHVVHTVETAIHTTESAFTEL